VNALRLEWRTAAGAFACIILLTLPFAHSVAVRNVSLGIAWIATLSAWRSLAVPRVPLLWLFAAWAALGLLSLIWAVDLQYSASELKTEVVYPVLVFALFFALSDVLWLERFRRTLLVATILSFASALYWRVFLAPEPTGALFNGPGMYSTYLVGVYPFVLVWLLKPNAPGNERIVHAVVIVAILCGGAITLNRMLWIVLALQTVLALALQWRGASATVFHRRLILFSAGAAIVFGGALYAISSKRFAVDPALPEAVGETMAGDVRLQMWKRAADRIAAHPFSGTGFGRGSLRQDFRTEFGDGLFWHAHNVVLNYGLSMGISGVAMILLLFGVVLWRFWQIWRSGDPALAPYALAGTVMVAGMFAKNMTDDLFIRQSALLYWSFAGMILGAHAKRRDA